MNVSHQTTVQLLENQRRTQHAESYGKSIAGQRLLDAIDQELTRRATPARQPEHCVGDCGDCNDTPICSSCSNSRCCIEDRNATACVAHRAASA